MHSSLITPNPTPVVCHIRLQTLFVFARMFFPEDVLLEHGLVGAFDTMAMTHDEELAIVYSDHFRSDATDESTSQHDQVASEGVTYLELQMYSQDLAAHLYHRFGVRRGDPVAVFCHGHAAAEVDYVIILRADYSFFRVTVLCTPR